MQAPFDKILCAVRCRYDPCGSFRILFEVILWFYFFQARATANTVQDL